MKKNIMFAVAIMMSTIIFAQPKGKDAHNRGGRQGEKMKTALALDDAQYATIKGINKKYAAKHQELRKDSAVAQKEKFASMKSLHESKEKEIQAVLTAEQKTKWDTYKAERVEKRNAKRE